MPSRPSRGTRRLLARALAPAIACVALAACHADRITQPRPIDAVGATTHKRVYYLAADEVPWDYAPSGINQISGQPFDDVANTFVGNGPDRIGHVYIKALYREYTDASFTRLKPRPPQWEHLGLMGPVLRGEVGDTIVVVFRNNSTIDVTLHPHGVMYDKDSEGAPYNDGTTTHDDDGVPPGGQHTYVWPIPERAGPGPMDGSSVMWMYHSHVDEPMDTNAGLIGPIIVTAKGKAKADGSPKDVDREFVTMFTVFDENSSWYLGRNINTYAGEPETVDPDDDEFHESNLMHSINGYVYGNLPLNALTMYKGERVRWYLMAMGTEVDLHTPHFHGQTVLYQGMRVDVVDLLPMGMKTVDMRPDNPGIWLYHCHVNDHITAGMLARFQVLP